MAHVKLSFGYDTERPRGEFMHTQEGRDFRKRQLEFLAETLMPTLSSLGAPRTFFILGEYLEGCLEDFTETDLCSLFQKPRNEIQVHSYSHPIFRPVADFGVLHGKPLVSEEAFLFDVQRGNETLERILHVKPKGLRTPFGYHHDMTDKPEMLARLREMGFHYVSSHLRTKHLPLGPLNGERQPHTYAHVGQQGVVEIPSHGFHDTIPFYAVDLVLEKALGPFKKLAWPISKMTSAYAKWHYTRLIKKAAHMKTDDTVYVSLCFHPFAVMRWDPQLEVHKRIVDADIVSYGAVAHSVLQQD